MIICLLAGFLAGIVSGMGIGGGAILIPALTIFMGISQPAAQKSNLIFFIPAAAAALISHVRNKAIEKTILPKIITGGLAGAVLGAMTAVRLDSELLRRLFGIFLLLTGVYEIFRKIPDRSE